MPTAALVLALTTACSVLRMGDVQPSAVDKKAHTLVQQTLNSLRPVVGTPKTKIFEARWTQCATEEPGEHRFDYTYALRVSVPHDKVKAALAAARADFHHRGYTLAYIPDQNAGAGASLPKSNWRINLSVDSATSILLGSDSDCVFTRHDPKT